MRPILLLLCVAASLPGFAQSRLTGAVRNKEGQPLEAATVLVHRQKDSSVIRSAVTGHTGSFTLDRIPANNYFLSITSVGYANYTSDPIHLDSAGSKQLTVVLAPAATNLEAVSVITKKPFVEWKLDRMIVNVGSSPFFTPGMSALEVLERSPGIEVDYLHNTIGLVTRPGTTIYINGRRTYLAGIDLLNYLRGLPAGSIEALEIISQPSARYDAATGGGVINILLKKNQADGLIGSVTASTIAGYYFKTRDNLMLNWRESKVNVNFTIGYSDNKTYNGQQATSSFRTAYGQPFTQYQQYTTSTITGSRSYTPQLALDYQLSKNTSLGVQLQGLFSDNHSITGGFVNLLDSSKQLIQQQPVPTLSRNTVTNPGVNLNWQQKFGGGRELSTDADYLHYHSPGVQDSYGLNGSLPSDIDIAAFKADYSQPIGPQGKDQDTKLEAGIKSSYVRTDNNSQYVQYDSLQKSWNSDIPLNNHFIYSENINAAYINLTRQLSKKWSIEFGLRGEQTIAKGRELVQGGNFRHQYFNIFPTGYAGFTPNDKHSFTLSYSRGIGRPSYLDLNPFRYVINAYNVRQGNPALQPDFGNVIQFEYHYRSEFNVGLVWYHGDNLQARVYQSTGQGDSLVTILTRTNVAFRRNIFLYFSFNKALTKWWNASWSVVFINAKLEDPANTGYPVDHLTGAKLNFNNQFPLGKGYSLDLRANYFTHWMEGIRIHHLPVWNNSVAVNKKLLHDKATLTLNLSDPFHVFRPGQITDATAFFLRTDNLPESRYLTITANYRFGKAKQQHRRHDGGSSEEQRRVNL
ncbi:MAG TPA: TonB-dependent receptor [Puia sp.]|uniref:TonB-dependent receptor domain-containing protein n=1 Tax=Puia sp. TaxID=2045100 RepID=UPI002D19F4C8|nr:TonB-dependent receptor [Puia sp.]HVU94234.1 TonB-dependent receptor [Puia sp.]